MIVDANLAARAGHCALSAAAPRSSGHTAPSVTVRAAREAAASGHAAQGQGGADLPAWLQRMAAGMADETPMEYLARNSHSFRYAARFLPKPYDALVAEVYAFCRFTDDMVDRDTVSGADELHARLADWRRLAQAAYAGVPSGFALLDKPLMEMGRRGIPFDYASDLIDGVAMDLPPEGSEREGRTGEIRYATLEELDAYSYRVASVVGLWLTRLVGVHETAVLERAAALGHAMQLTNILRDVGEDWRNGRLYLPLDVLARHGVGEDDIARAASGGPLPRGWVAVMEELMDAADVRYARALGAVKALPAFFRVPVAVSGYVYRDIHTALRRNGYDNFTRRAHTSKPRKLWLGAKARAWLLTGARAPRAVVQDAEGAAAEKPRRPLVSVLVSLLSGAALAATEIPNLAEIAANAREEIAVVDAALLRAPADPALHVRKLRALHTVSVHDGAHLAAAREALGRSERLAAGSSKEFAPTLLAYRGAFDVVEARHATWPTTRLIALRRGLDRLDEAVKQAPASVDVRYLRLTSTWYLPALLRRDRTIEDDFKALAELLPVARGDYPPQWYLPVTDFVLKNAPLAPQARERLREARAQAAAPTRG